MIIIDVYTNKFLQEHIRYVPMQNTFVLKEENFWGGNISEHFKNQLRDIQKSVAADGLLILPVGGLDVDKKYCYRQYFFVLDVQNYDPEAPLLKVWDSYLREFYLLPTPDNILRKIEKKKVGKKID